MFSSDPLPIICEMKLISQSALRALYGIRPIDWWLTAAPNLKGARKIMTSRPDDVMSLQKLGVVRVTNQNCSKRNSGKRIISSRQDQ